MYALLIPLLLSSWHADYVRDHCAACPECCATISTSDYLVERALECGATERLARDLLHVEDLAGIPERLRGMTLAKGCLESRFNTRAVGDQGRAVGIFQLWPWALQFIYDRTDPIASAHVLLGRLVATERTVHRHCPRVRDRWRLAWIRINRGPFWRRADRAGEPRCSGTSPAGMKRLKRWHRAR